MHIEAHLSLHVLNHELDFLSPLQQLFSLTWFMLSFTFVNETVEFVIYFIFESSVAIVEFFVIFDEDNIIVPFNVVKYPASINNLDLVILHILILRHLVDIIAS